MSQQGFGISWTTSLQKGLAPVDVASGYVIVSEHELPEPAAQ
jgi:hypothetical protein